MEAQKVCFVTSNKGKLREAQEILGKELYNRPLDLIEIQSESSSVVAGYKVKEAARIVGGPVIIDDTALHFHALGGLPGAYIRAFTEHLKPTELERVLAGFEDKTATVVCSVAYCAGPDAEPQLFEGRLEGTIVPPRGSGGFGFDPIFQPIGYTQTFAEMEQEEKNSISHRYKAFSALRDSGLLE